MISVIFIAIAMVFDGILNSIFPTDFSSMGVSFVSQMGFLAMILLTLKLSWNKALAIFFVFGLFHDLTRDSYILLNASSFALTFLVSRYWYKHVNDSYFELTSLLMLSLFIKELIIWIFLRLSALSVMSLMVWFSQHQFLSIITHIPIAIIIIFLNFIRLRIMAKQSFSREKGERLFWMKLETTSQRDVI